MFLLNHEGKNDLLLCKEGADLRYIEYTAKMKELDEIAAAKAVTIPVEQKADATQEKKENPDGNDTLTKTVIVPELSEIHQAVLKGNKAEIKKEACYEKNMGFMYHRFKRKKLYVYISSI